jgi:S-adenosylmethionine synthetase
MDHRTATIIVAVDKQSLEIASSVFINKAPEDIGAGDQGLMIGYATD